ncbi:MAG TPA: phosphoserine phosphatase [Candidatus Thermoplasmatota archaeon]|nr:phosphoserine phosphatase [Candidatus Thermoplasmatota archaeon]
MSETTDVASVAPPAAPPTDPPTPDPTAPAAAPDAPEAPPAPPVPNPNGPKPGMKKEELQSKANLLRRERDRLNDEARKHAEERDGFNAEVRGLVNQANEHKKRRDELNEGVKRSKELRDEANKAADEAQKGADTLRRERMPDGTPGESIAKLKKEARTLEMQHMTVVLTPAKEKALMERLKEIGKLIRSKESTLRSDPELKAALESADQLKEKAEKSHAKVGEMAEKAQAEHDAMIKLYKQSDKLRKQADKLQEKFVIAKMEADKIHKTYIEFVNAIHEIEDAAAGNPGARGEGSQARNEAAAEMVFQKFKAGEKLSTEDLLTLQKAGLL